MVLNLRLFPKTSDLENKVDSFFLKLAEAGVIYRLAVRNYLREGLSEEYTTRFEQVCDIETSADTLRSEIKLAIYSDLLIPDSRGDVLGLIETADEVFSLMKTSLWAFSIESPTIDEELVPGYRRLTNMVKGLTFYADSGRRATFNVLYRIDFRSGGRLLTRNHSTKISLRRAARAGTARQQVASVQSNQIKNKHQVLKFFHYV